MQQKNGKIKSNVANFKRKKDSNEVLSTYLARQASYIVVDDRLKLSLKNCFVFR